MNPAPAGTGIPAQIGPYRIERELARGGMGIVYLARDTRLDRAVAIKVLPDLFAADPERLARFTREAQVLASLNHPNIAHVYGVESGALVMELVDGEDLAHRLARGPVPIDEVLPIAAQIAQALDAAHSQGIVHRDLKPANVKVRVDGVVKVLDFGLAKAWEPVTDASSGSLATITSPALTAQGVIVGTAAYLSPEQARGRPVDRRADIWAFGCVVFELLTGTRAFRGETVTDTIAAIIEREPDWSKLPAGTPAGVVRLLRRSLVKDPAARLRDAGDALLDLREAPVPPPDPRRPNPARGFALAAAGLVAGAAVMFVAAGPWRGRDTRRPEGIAGAAEFPLPSGDPRSLAVSADGQTLAWVAPGADRIPRVWIRKLDSPVARELPGTDGASYPFLAPDGRAVGFFAGRRLLRVDLDSGTSQFLADTSAVSPGASWGTSDIIVFSSRFGINRIDAAGGQPATVVQLDRSRHENSLRFPSFLPDGRHFLYVVRSGRPEENAAYLASLDGPPTRLMATSSKVIYAPPGYLLFLRGGTLFAQRFELEKRQLAGQAVPLARDVAEETIGVGGGFAASMNGVLAYGSGQRNESTLRWMDRRGAVLGTIGEPAVYAQFRIAPDGRRVAAAIADTARGSRSVWVLEPGRTPSRLTFPATHDWAPAWSPDGTRIVFGSYRDGPLNVYVKDAAGSQPDEPLAVSDDQKDPSDWSPDGRYVVYRDAGRVGRGDLVAVDTRARDTRIQITKTDSDERIPQFSGDSRWIAYVSDETGRAEVFVQPFPPTGARWQVTVNGGDEPRWRADARELYYIDRAGMLVAAAIETDGSRFAWKNPQPLFTIGPSLGPGFATRYDVSRDGSRFLVAVPMPPAPLPPATVVLNWTARLPR